MSPMTTPAFASHLFMNGVILETVAKLPGHSTVAYAHLSPEHKTRAIKILDTAYLSEPKENAKDGRP